MKEDLFNYIKDAATCGELPSKMRAVFPMTVLKNNCNYEELLNSKKRYAEATVNVIYFDDSDIYPIMIISGWNNLYQDFYYDNCWKILSTTNPEQDWVKLGLRPEVPDDLVDNFAAGNLVGYLEDAVEFINK